MTLHELLTQDKTDGLQAPVDIIAAGAAGLTNTSNTDLNDFGERLASAVGGSVADLESARSVFEEVSGVLIELWAVAPPSQSAAPVVYHVYCPMVKKGWLQTSREVANPYAPYMLRCGSVKGVVAGEEPEGESK